MTTKKETTVKKTAVKPAKGGSVSGGKAAAPKAEKPAKGGSVSGGKVIAAGHQVSGPYLYAIGRRKSGIAQVRVYTSGKGVITVNGKPMKDYFPVDELQDTILVPLKAAGMDATADVIVAARGGGIRGQADAVKLGIARALLVHNPDLRATLKPLGTLTRDPREKERKKYGLKKARKSPQWAKR